MDLQTHILISERHLLFSPLWGTRPHQPDCTDERQPLSHRGLYFFWRPLTYVYELFHEHVVFVLWGCPHSRHKISFPQMRLLAFPYTNSAGSLSSHPIVRSWGVILVDSFGVARQALRGNQDANLNLVAPRTSTLSSSAVTFCLNRSTCPFPRGFLTLVRIFLTSYILQSSLKSYSGRFSHGRYG